MAAALYITSYIIGHCKQRRVVTNDTMHVLMPFLTARLHFIY